MPKRTGKIGSLSELRKAAEANPDSAKAQMQLGTALLKAGFPEEAEKALVRATELEPDYAPAWVNLGGLRMAQWNFDGCIEANQKAAKLDPDLLLAHYNQGLAYLYKNQADKMVDCFRRVLALDPNHGGAHYHMAVALHKLGNIDEARMELTLSINLGHSPQPELIRELMKHPHGPAQIMEFGPDTDNKTKGN